MTVTCTRHGYRIQAICLLGICEDVILKTLATCVHMRLYLQDIFLNWEQSQSNFGRDCQARLHRGGTIFPPAKNVWECPFPHSVLSNLDFCQSNRLKMVSVFSYEWGQTYFSMLKAVFLFLWDVSLCPLSVFLLDYWSSHSLYTREISCLIKSCKFFSSLS